MEGLTRQTMKLLTKHTPNTNSVNWTKKGILLAVHTVNNLDCGNKPENEGYEGEGPQNLTLAWVQVYE